MENTVHDVVCGMDIDPATAAGKSEYKGQTYYFCSAGCKRSFDKDRRNTSVRVRRPISIRQFSPFDNGLSAQPGQAILLIYRRAKPYSMIAETRRILSETGRSGARWMGFLMERQVR